ncbi:coiled-coil domain-containing protein [Microbacterium caowuchunii]|uniref:coiled-coil domain-containing protein n=1 Tax=Microbacterium caowuchunii TaxID=2614638 RepID=UPI0017813D20|nr:hypothetical protein [Microbacterium caowuchunii]
MPDSARPTRHRVRTPGVLLTLGITLGALLTGAPPAQAADTPSWADVESAQADQTQARSVATRIEAALADAEKTAAAASRSALEASANATSARAAAEAAATRAAELEAGATVAEERLDQARHELGGFASRLYRTHTDGPLVARLLTSAEPESLLARLGLLDKLTGTWARTAATAGQDALTARSLRDQARLASAARDDAASTAERTAAEAQLAADTESALLTAVQDQVSELYAQLAALRETTADVERRYRLARQVAAQPAPSGGGSAATNPPAPGGPATGGGTPVAPSPAPGGPPTYGVSVDPAGAREYARGAIGAYGWGDDQFGCLVLLWNRESGWRANALNPSSGAYGIPQALPAEKMAAAGADWRTNGNTQVNWGLSYIRSRYGSPCAAWDHSQRVGWY